MLQFCCFDSLSCAQSVSVVPVQLPRKQLQNGIYLFCLNKCLCYIHEAYPACVCGKSVNAFSTIRLVPGISNYMRAIIGTT